MKIHSLCIVKNEDDVIEEALVKASTWSDFIYVFDNGSSDTTWSKVNSLSQKYQQIIPYKQDDCEWSDSLRGQIFNHYRNNFKSGDWIARLDSDEIYIDNPKLFLGKVPEKYSIVCAAMFTYYFTDKDWEKYQQNPDLYSDNVSVEEKCKYYRNDLSEIRFFRYKDSLIWPDKSKCILRSDYKDWPTGLKGDAFPTRIWLKNYRYRSPQQIQKRIDLRRQLTKKNLFPQEMKYMWKEHSANLHIDGAKDFENWKSRIAKSSILDFDRNNHEYVLREDLMLNLNTILSRYFLKIDRTNFIQHYFGRPIKRKLVRLNLLPNQFS